MINIEEKEKSVCCNAPLIGNVQCEICGIDGRKFETDFEDEDNPNQPHIPIKN